MLTTEDILLLTKGRSWLLKAVGGGFQGAHFVLGTDEVAARWFVKEEPKGSLGDYYKALGTFVKEPKVYSELLPQMKRYAGGSKLWPDVHIAREGLMVLEDLSSSGWSICNDLNEEHIRIALVGLADLHAASLLLQSEIKSQTLSERFPAALAETYFGNAPGHPGLKTWVSFTESAAKIFKKYFPGRDLTNALRAMTDTPQIAKSSYKHRNCFCHGDPWPNNIFFKHENDEPVAACFVDMANARYAPPATDVLLFLHILQVAPSSRQELLHQYHDRLACRVPSFTVEEFLSSCEDCEAFALCLAPLYIYLTRLPAGVMAQVTRSQEEFIKFAMGADSPALNAMEEDQGYREAVLTSLGNLLEYYEKTR